jgi:hypothetical protein
MEAVRDRVSFDASKATRSSMRKGFSRSVGGKLDADIEELLERSGRSVKTRSQQSMEDAFGAPKAAPKPEEPPKPPRGGRSRPSLARKRSKRW